MRNNEVHQNVLGPEIDISVVLDRDSHTLYRFSLLSATDVGVSRPMPGSLCDEAAMLRDMIKWTQYISKKCQTVAS